MDKGLMHLKTPVEHRLL